MDFLNKYFAQIKEVFEGMTPGARITSALLLAVTVASLGYLFTAGFHPGGDVFLLDNRAFTSDELSPMLGAFATEGLAAPEVVGGKIRVARGKETEYVAALAKAGALPHDFSAIFDDALKASGVFEDQPKFQARLRIAKQRYFEELFRAMPDYDRATVIISEDIKPGLRRERVVTASATVKAVGTLPLTDEQVKSIRHTVKAADAGLKLEDIVVIDMNTGKAHRAMPGEGSDGEGTLMAQEQRRQEDYYRAKVADLLGLVPGAIVTPMVELAPEKKLLKRTTAYDKETSISINTNETKTSREHTGETNGGRPGFVAQQSNTARTLPTVESKPAEEKEKSSELSETKLPAGEETETEMAPHTVERVAVAIAVPTSWFTQIWQKRNPTPPGEDPKMPAAADIDPIRTAEIERIKSLVAGALPVPRSVTTPDSFDKKALVEVHDFEDLVPPAAPEPTLAENAGSWLAQNWSMVGLIVLGIMSLAMLRSMIRSTPSGGRNPIAEFAPPPRERSDSDEEEGEGEPRKFGFSASGASLRDELSELVATDPETAANILKNWIGAAVK